VTPTKPKSIKSAQIRLGNFFADLRNIIPKQRLVDSSLVTVDSSGLSRSCAGLILVKNEVEVRHVLRAAFRHSVPIDPVSTGQNTGYGDFLPENPHAVILDLRKMNRIVEFNREEGWIRVQPGVSQGDVAEYLKKHRAPYEFDLTYWLKEASVIGNSLERGRTLVSERERDLIGARVALPSGEILRTGFLPNGRSPLPSGMNLHSLLFQTNLGVVVEGVVRLKRRDIRKNYLLLGFGSFNRFVKDIFGALRSINSPLVRPLRWFCIETYALAPVSRRLGGRGRGGVLAIEVDGKLAAASLQKLLGSPRLVSVQSISREKLLLPLSPGAFTLRAPMAFFSFSIRNSARGLREAKQFTVGLRRRFDFEFFETISFLDTASAVFLLRVQAKSAREASKTSNGFRKISAAIEKNGYVLYRGHSGLDSKLSADQKIKKSIKSCFDPKGLIAPGRYGL
jgi:hypothetical protein